MPVAVFLAEGLVGFCSLAFEVIAARLVAPYAGMSTDTWTAIIAAFLLSMAFGNRIGGALAMDEDAPRTLRRAALATAAGGVWVAATPLLMFHWDAIILAPAPGSFWRIILFVAAPCIPTGLFFGIATPLLMVSALALVNERQRGIVVGAMYGAGALGGVLGVLAALWFLLDNAGVRVSLFCIGLLALATALATLYLSYVLRHLRTVPA